MKTRPARQGPATARHTDGALAVQGCPFQVPLAAARVSWLSENSTVKPGSPARPAVTVGEMKTLFSLVIKRKKSLN